MALPITHRDLPAVIKMGVDFDNVPLILGSPGVGKTHVIRQWAKDNGYSILVELLGTSDPMMFRGLMAVDSTGDVPKTVDCVPAIIKKVMDIRAETKKPVLLFLDELTLATPSMQGAALTFLQDRELAGFKLPEDTRIICAGNSAEDSSAVYDLTGPAQNRVVQYQLEPVFEDWKNWMLERMGHPLLLGALEALGEFFYTDNAGEATGPFPSPRQWQHVSNMMNWCDETNTSYDALLPKATMFGFVGDQAATAVSAILDLADGVPTPKQIMRSPKSAILPSKDDRKRAYLAMSTCVTMIARAEQGERKAVAEATFEYMKRLPDSFVVAFMATLTQASTTGWALAARPRDVSKYGPALGALSKDN